MLNEKCFGIDNDISPIENVPVSPVTEFGGRGEAIYTIKTAYTDIEIDGKKDAAYDHGIHLSGLICRAADREYYKDRPTNLDVYMVRGQDGRLYIFGHVVDPDIFCTEDFFAKAVDQCDCIQLHIDSKNIGITMNKVARFLPYEGDKPFPRRQRDSRFVITDEGFDFEIAIDNGGKPFEHGDKIGMTFFYYDTNEFVDKTNYKKTVLMLSSELLKKVGDFEIPMYYDPDGSIIDSFRFSEDSVSGKYTVVREIPAPTGDMLTDILSGSASVAVVGGGKNCAIQTIDAAHRIYQHLCRERANATLIVECAPTSDRYDFDYEIIFNNTIRRGGNRLWDALSPAEYAIELDGNRILVNAPIEKSADITVEKLLSLFGEAKGGKRVTAEDIKLYGRLDGVPFDCVPRPRRLDHITDVGDNAYMYLTLDADRGDLDFYLTALAENGWALYTENTMAKIRTFTYTGHGAVITVVYSDDCAENLPSSLRVVVEPAERTTLPMLAPEPYEKKVTPLVSMLDPNNLCMVYRLTNGEFLILDGGQMPPYRNLYNVLMEQSGGHPVIAAWFFSHFHQDHDGSFVKIVEDDECLGNITIKRIIYNYPQKLVSDTAGNRDDQANLKKWQSLLDKTGAEIFQARTGQRYYFTDAVLELPWTYEDLLPYNLFCDDTNITCTGYRLTIEGQTHMLLGDTSEGEMRCAYKRMGDYLKSDFVQLAHHGHGSFKSPFELYQFVNADVVFVPGPPAVGAAEIWACENAKEVYVRTDGNMTLELPHYAK